MISLSTRFFGQPRLIMPTRGRRTGSDIGAKSNRWDGGLIPPGGHDITSSPAPSGGAGPDDRRRHPLALAEARGRPPTGAGSPRHVGPRLVVVADDDAVHGTHLARGQDGPVATLPLGAGGGDDGIAVDSSEPEMPLKSRPDLAQALSGKVAQPLDKTLARDGPDLLAEHLALPSQSAFAGWDP